MTLSRKTTAKKGMTWPLTAIHTLFIIGKDTLSISILASVELGDSATGNITRIDNALAKLPEHLKKYQSKLADLSQQLESAKTEAAKPFAQEAELQRKSARLAELDAALNLGGRAGGDAAA